MVRWNHQLNGHESEQAPGDGEGQGSQACCSPWDHKESDTAEQLNINSSKAMWKRARRLAVYKPGKEVSPEKQILTTP